MDYHVARNGEQLGQFTAEEIRHGLFDGKFQPTDLAWKDGQADWQPLSALFGQITPPSRVKSPPATQVPLSSTVAPDYHSPTNGMAIAALVMGIVSIFTFGLCGIGSIVTIILGHMALTRVRQSGGSLGGKGMAVAGLVMGYASIALAIIGILASLALPTFTRIQERGNVTKSISNVRQLNTACRIYASDHNGKLPSDLQELVTSSVLDQDHFDKLLRCPLSTEYPGYDYFGAGVEDSAPGETVIFLSKADVRGKRIVGQLDGSTALGLPSGSTAPASSPAPVPAR
ncbi:DUF4190 domain-containing protein [Verrucomicrobium sp. BvORR106]|uniref:DUF4190 domain-containing protein n=1 Tax=Verrucomicrobium sp. BvORR106 TaxID=1403819 RepID=UPI0006900114|nr:DUF4190 domain-containing protein [Verrucomicrobium sp. BvORR106]